MYVCSAGILRQTTDVFPDDIKLDVDNAAYADGVEIGVFERIGDDTHLEGVIRWAAYGEAHAVDRDTAFVNREISALCHDRVVLVGERKGCASVHVLHLGADGYLVDMPLHDVSVQTRI